MFLGGNGKDRWIVVLIWLIGILLSVVFLFFIVDVGHSAEVCLSVEDAKRLVVELEQKRVLEQEVKEQEGLIENLKKQVDLLKQENQLLKEQVQLLKEQKDMYKVIVEEKDKEIKKQRVVGFFEKVKSFLMGTGVGVVAALLILH
jgi:cytochrome c-type biogenesis protein CcmH/NrfG